MIEPDGIQAAAEREEEFHPRTAGGKPITAWRRRAATIGSVISTLNNLLATVGDLGRRVAALEGGTGGGGGGGAAFAPRAYNTTPSADARFCMKSEYGVQRVTDGGGGFWIDRQGIRYDESGRDLGGRSKTIVPELKGANSMDGLEPCDEYVGPTGVRVGGSAGYPAASFER